MMNQFRTKLINLPNKSFYALYKKDKYLVTKDTIVNNSIIKLYALNLSNNDIVSCNYFLTIKDGLLKPCEMTDKKVIDFVMNLEIISD